ncbi:MAG: putative sulfate exporter family transporter [Planctomycetota bacterium]
MAPPDTKPSPKPAPIAWVVVVLGLGACAAPWADPGLMLAIGVAAALLGLADQSTMPWTKPASRLILQACVVLLGLGMNLAELARAGGTGILFAVGTIALTFAAGLGLSRLLKTSPKLTILLSSGTAICGGSAIAAVSTVIAAPAAEISVAIGTVFLLNAAGLYLLPEIGYALHMSQEQFGVWAAVSIHDISSVVGAAKRFGDESLQIATAVKLSRALWIAPIAFIAGLWYRRTQEAREASGSRPGLAFPVPLFIILFIAASALRTYVPAIAPYHESYFKPIATHGMAAALFLIGLGLSRRALKAVGWRALTLGILLWVLISVTSLIVVRQTIE